MEDTYPSGFEDKEMSEETQRRLQSILERYEQMSDEEKEQFQQGAFDVLTKSFKDKLDSNTFWSPSYHSVILFISAASIVIFLLVIITRKLYKRVKDRESRKEMKRKLKEQKAAKKKK